MDPNTTEREGRERRLDGRDRHGEDGRCRRDQSLPFDVVVANNSQKRQSVSRYSMQAWTA